MRREILSYLACPHCDTPLRVVGEDHPADVRAGALDCERCGQVASIIKGIPRFVPSDSYTVSFSFEWTRFSTTQLDSARGWRLSEERLQASLDEPLAHLKDKLVLDAGCGMGRFAEIVVKHGGTVVGVDLSRAVDAAAKNLARWDRCHLLQADLTRLPLRKGMFDVILSLGVLHHTPEPRRTFEALLPFLKPGGKIAMTVYSGYNKVYVQSTELWRRLTTRLPVKWVYRWSHLAIPLYYLYRIPVLGWIGKGLWPISMHPDPEWRLLDTFDCYTPRFQHYATHPEVYQWFREAGLTDIACVGPAISFIGTRPPVEARVPQAVAIHG